MCWFWQSGNWRTRTLELQLCCNIRKATISFSRVLMIIITWLVPRILMAWCLTFGCFFTWILAFNWWSLSLRIAWRRVYHASRTLIMNSSLTWIMEERVRLYWVDWNRSWGNRNRHWNWIRRMEDKWRVAYCPRMYNCKPLLILDI